MKYSRLQYVLISSFADAELLESCDTVTKYGNILQSIYSSNCHSSSLFLKTYINVTLSTLCTDN